LKKVCWARIASSAPMGQQVHESFLRSALQRELGPDWRIADVGLLPVRAPRGRGSRRIPLRLVWAAPYPVAARAGSLVYGRADLVHRFELRCPPSRGREIVTVHDVAPLRFPDEGSLPRWAAESARNAAAVICGSEFAAEEVRLMLGAKRTHVVPSGVDPRWADAEPLSADELAQAGLHEPLVVHAGGATLRKNLDALAGAWPEVAAAYPDALLALCGPPHPHRDELFASLPNVRYLGYADRSFVTRLMRTAAVVVVPSTYEGFGLPPLEAMAAGAVVVAAARGALLEVCGDAAILVEPSAHGVGEGILEALAGGPHVERLRAEGRKRASSYTWERAAKATAALYDEVAG
jgi:glycosyltransferase involved in cell wall biosynthesis